MAKPKRRGRPPGTRNPNPPPPPPLGNTRAQKCDQPKRQVCWRIRADLLEALDARAVTGTTKTELIETALERFLM